MKQVIYSLFLLQSGISFSQSAYLEFNDVRARINDDGSFFSNIINSTASYEVPVGSSNHTIYQMSFMTAAIEADSTVHTASNSWPGTNDFYPGPISDDYGSAYYTSNFGNSIWVVHITDINYHKTHFADVGYVIPATIANWPGNGDISEGVAAQLAPYVDVDGDLQYIPSNGDYPYIQGEEAIYVIMNDEAGPHNFTGGTALGIEVHAMFYQFASDDLNVHQTTFLNTKIYNRRDTSYSNFMFGMFMDFDLGFPLDDFIGSDSARSMAYVYNAAATDPGGNGQPGYGLTPPAFGAKFLNVQAGSAMTSGIVSDPSTPLEHYMWMQGRDMSDTPLYSSPPSTFAYYGNPYDGTGWNEISTGNSGGDRRMFLSAEGSPLATGASLCYDIAFIYADENVSATDNADKLLDVADFIQGFYNDTIQPCNTIVTGITNSESEPMISIHPNPSTGLVTIDAGTASTLSVFDLSGRPVLTAVATDENGTAYIELETSGIYIVMIETGSARIFRRIEIVK